MQFQINPQDNNSLDWGQIGAGAVAISGIAIGVWGAAKDFFKKKDAGTEHDNEYKTLEGAFQLIDRLQADNKRLVDENERLSRKIQSLEDRVESLTKRVGAIDGKNGSKSSEI